MKKLLMVVVLVAGCSSVVTTGGWQVEMRTERWLVSKCDKGNLYVDNRGPGSVSIKGAGKEYTIDEGASMDIELEGDATYTFTPASGAAPDVEIRFRTKGEGSEVLLK